MKLKVGLIRVLTVDTEEALRSQEKVILDAYDDFEITSRCIADQPEGIHDDKTEKIAIPKIVALAKQYENEGYDAVYISCAADPGIQECRQTLNIPVIGAGSCCAAVAVSVGQKIGVLSITDFVPQAMLNVMGEKYVAMKQVDGVTSVLDILKPEGMGRCIDAAKALSSSGCDVIALGCAGFSTLKIHREIAQKTGLRVIDPVLAAGGDTENYYSHFANSLN